MPNPTHHFPGPGTLDRALALVRYLRAHCPWDAEQTAESLIPHLLEETHEVVDAIRDGDDGELEGELGDLLLNLAFQIVVAEEEGTMDADSVYGRLEAKMIARHPHVFGDAEKRSWEESKARERDEGESVLAGLARGLDPLTKAYRIQERVAGVGFDWEDHQGALEKVREELQEVSEALVEATEAPGERAAPSQETKGDGEAEPHSGEPSADAVTEEIGDLLFAVVNLARLAGVHPTTALARANAKFTDRFQRLEDRARERDVRIETAGLEALDGIWNEVKEEE
ncbi:MAG: nucleoside triphosphate pyrophosphohydrolase [Longimicrobiales bacterium]|nr:nucleoside triphosphate pyrophosphohydrolase [Longimicrobiales bacterium]